MIKSKDELKGFSKMAAAAFVEKQVPLNSTLEKIAREESLNPDQLRFVTQEANKESWARLFKINKEAAYDFTLGDSEIVLSKLQDNFAPAAVHDIDLDYNSEPVSVKTAAVEDPHSFFGVEKTASAGRTKKEVVRDLTKKLEKLSHAKSELDLIFLQNNTAAEGQEIEIIKSMKNELLGMPWKERAPGFMKFAAAACRARPGERTLNRLNRIRHVLEKQSVMEKTASLEAPEEYISKNMPATIVNGNHELIIRIKTLMEYDDKAHEAFQRRSLVDDMLPKIQEAIREL